ncbi:FAD-dependent oxidoreductase [Brachybacterium alimentarium]|uniref:FAD-dependent oxidoreductase n=1 Tax=Brachybacterium alimentarium TaxID=47845 RepID=UPI003F921DBA
MLTDAADSLGRSCEVLIVGGGPTGLLLAILLRQRGVEAVVLERRQRPGAHSRAIGLHPPALDALQAVGLEEIALARGARIAHGTARRHGSSTSHHREHDQDRGQYRGREHEHEHEHSLGWLSFERSWPARPFVLSLPQSLTEELLASRLAELAPDALRRGEDVVGLEDAPTGMRVWTRSSRSDGTDATAARPRVTRWHASVLVGADGSHSTVRALAGVETALRTYPDTYLMGDVADPAPPGRSEGHGHSEDHGRSEGSARTADPPGTGPPVGTSSTATIHLGPDGVVESFPLPDGRRRWVAHTGTAPSASSAEDLAALVRARTGQRIDPLTCSMVSAFTVRRRTVRTMLSGRLVLIGDAAHEISPIGGQGITLGWLDALALAPLLEQVITRDLRHRLEDMPLLREAARRRLRAARLASRLAELNMVLGRPRSGPLARGRDAVIRAVLRSPLRHRLAWAYAMGWAVRGRPAALPRRRA